MTFPDRRSGTKPIPLPVQREADAMARRTGTVPLIEYKSPTTIRISHSSGTLRVEITFQRGSRGWRSSGRQLLYNGERQTSTDIWAKYDALSERLSTDGTFALPTITPCSENSLPSGMQESLRIARRRLSGRSDIALSTGRDARGRYVLILESMTATVHMLFEPLRRHGQESAEPVAVDPLRMVTADGEDLTEEVNGKLHKALSHLRAEPATGTDETGTGSTQGAQAGGPSSRKGTVLRL